MDVVTQGNGGKEGVRERERNRLVVDVRGLGDDWSDGTIGVVLMTATACGKHCLVMRLFSNVFKSS